MKKSKTTKPRLLDFQIALLEPKRALKTSSAWLEHIPFAFFLMEVHKPRILVELGTHTGASYCAFCQAVVHLGLATQCYAVDTWEGDEHAGYYDSSIYSDLAQYNTQHYSAFSHLMRLPFDEAIGSFADGSIDLLHIDGCHYYENVRHDFETWLPKLSPRSVVIIHDSAVVERNFGVGRFLSELGALYPVFEFKHGSGLGVVGVGKALKSEPIAELLRNRAEPDNFRKFFSRIGRTISLEDELDRSRGELDRSRGELDRSRGELDRMRNELDRSGNEMEKRDKEFSLQLEAKNREIQEHVQEQTRLAAHLSARDAQLIHVLKRHTSGISFQLLWNLVSFPSGRMRDRIRTAVLIRYSGLFDPVYYLAENPAILLNNLDPLFHFIRFGAFEGRSPHPLFDTAFYLRENPDVAASGINPLVHYLEAGGFEGRNPHPLFHSGFYLDSYRDVKKSKLNPLSHFVKWGGFEGRNPNPDFDTQAYIRENPEVKRKNLNPLVHYIYKTKLESEGPDRAYFDFAFPRNREESRLRILSDCAASLMEAGPKYTLSLFRGLLSRSLHQTVQNFKDAAQIIPSGLFNDRYYLANNRDVLASGLHPLAHFIKNGARERRRPSARFNTEYYIKRYNYVASSGCNPLVHYIRYGRDEGHSPNTAIKEPAGNPELFRLIHRINSSASRMLFIDAALPTPDKDSGSITIMEIMKSFQSLGFSVTFIPADLEHSDKYAKLLENTGVICITGKLIPDLYGFLEQFGNLFDIVVLSRVSVAAHHFEMVRNCCPQAKIIFETVDLHFLREQREAKLKSSPELLASAMLVKACELDAICRADATIVHSTVEQDVLRMETPDARVIHLPYILDVREMGPGFEARENLLFIGGFAHQPNVDAVLYFVKEVFPLILNELPGIRLFVVGSNPPPEIMELTGGNVTVTGYVEHLKPWFDQCRLSVAPLRWGAGYKGKVAMSMAYGVPCVVSPVAAEGMQLQHGENVLIGKDPESFAKAVVSLHQDRGLWEHLSAASRQFVIDRFSAEAGTKTLAEMLTAIGFDFAGRTGTPAAATLLPCRAIYPSRFMRDLHNDGMVRFSDCALIPHGVVFNHPTGAKYKNHGELVSPPTLRLLFAGRLVQVKGTHTALEALPFIQNALPQFEVKLTLVGDTLDTDYVTRLHSLISSLDVKQMVEFRPPVPEKDLFDLFQNHDIYIFPSLYEPFSLTLLLAMEAGIPTVASDIGGNLDIIADRKSGLLFPAGKAESLASSVIDLARDPELRQSLSEEGRKAASELTLDRMVDQIEGYLLRGNDNQ